MNQKHGTYVLVLRCDGKRSVMVGRLGLQSFRPGYYLYVGSAFGPGGIRSRVSRHCRKMKKMHWHIDYLRDVTDLETVWYTHSDERREHEWAGILSMMASSESVRGFGCSDCRCGSHLFYFSKRPGLEPFRQYTGDSVMIWNCFEVNE